MTQISERLRRALESDCTADISQIIAEKRPEDLEQLKRLLTLDTSVDTKYRTRAIHILGRWGHPQSVAKIHEILPQLDEAGRISAVSALGRLNTKKAIAAVLESVNDSSPQVRKTAVTALAKINTQETKAKLREISERDPEQWIRAKASKYLSKAQ
jgi:HEAT repeat protein